MIYPLAILIIMIDLIIGIMYGWVIIIFIREYKNGIRIGETRRIKGTEDEVESNDTLPLY